MSWEITKSVAKDIANGSEVGPETIKWFGESVLAILKFQELSIQDDGSDDFVKQFRPKLMDLRDGHWLALHAAGIFANIDTPLTDPELFERFEELARDDPFMERCVKGFGLDTYMLWLRETLADIKPSQYEARRQCYLKKHDGRSRL